MNWKEVNKELPEECVMVLGYSKDWVHPDFNPKGIRECFINSELGSYYWTSSIWNNMNDCWDTSSDIDDISNNGNPTHWMELPDVPRQPCKRCGGTGLIHYIGGSVICKDCSGIRSSGNIKN